MCLCNLMQFSLDYWHSVSLNNFAEPPVAGKIRFSVFLPHLNISLDPASATGTFCIFHFSKVSFTSALLYLYIVQLCNSHWLMNLLLYGIGAFDNHSTLIVLPILLQSLPILFEIICKTLIFNCFLLLCLTTMLFTVSLSIVSKN